MQHSPKGERYVSLFKQGDSPDAQALPDKQRARLRQLVMLQCQPAAALAEANEGAAMAAAAAGVIGTFAGKAAPFSRKDCSIPSRTELAMMWMTFFYLPKACLRARPSRLLQLMPRYHRY